MEYRSLSVVAFLIALSSFPGVAQADFVPTEEQTADWNRRLESADELQKKGMRQQLEADKVLKEKQLRCFEKFQVNACNDEARLEHAQKTHEARRVENEGKSLQRQVTKEQLSAKDANYVAEADARAANLKAREAETAAEQARSEANRAAQLAEKEKQAAEGAKRRAEDAEKLRQKQAKHAAKVAKKMEKAKLRPVEGAAR